MALIECLDCGKVYSNNAVACPVCANPTPNPDDFIDEFEREEESSRQRVLSQLDELCPIFGISGWRVKEKLAKLPRFVFLEPGENILALSHGKMEGKHRLLVVTNQRLYFIGDNRSFNIPANRVGSCSTLPVGFLSPSEIYITAIIDGPDHRNYRNKQFTIHLSLKTRLKKYNERVVDAIKSMASPSNYWYDLESFFWFAGDFDNGLSFDELFDVPELRDDDDDDY